MVFHSRGNDKNRKILQSTSTHEQNLQCQEYHINFWKEMNENTVTHTYMAMDVLAGFKYQHKIGACEKHVSCILSFIKLF